MSAQSVKDEKKAALAGLRVLDLSRVLAGPYCTQILGDLGAEVLKVERPGAGDDTRLWGPPFLMGADGSETSESAYYLSANRNKKSVAIDLSKQDGQKLVQALVAQADVVIENFKVGGLEKYGLGYAQLRKSHPGLIYCAITGFGQTGPLAHEPGYDFLAQGMAGLMASTGKPGEEPMKAGVALSDIMTGLNAAIGILAALHHRDKTGEGQMVDIALVDCTLSAMTNLAQYYLTSGQVAPRLGNAHSTIVPYQVFEAADGHVIVAVGNNEQFARLCGVLGESGWPADPRFARNRDRVANREALTSAIAEHLRRKPMAFWLSALQEADVPCGPVNTMDQVFAEKQVQARGMEISMQHPLSPDPVKLVGSPLKLSATPPSYSIAPPFNGQHTREVLQNLLGLDLEHIEVLAQNGVIGL